MKKLKKSQSTFSHFINRSRKLKINQTIERDRLSRLLTNKVNVVFLQQRSLLPIRLDIFEQRQNIISLEKLLFLLKRQQTINK